MSQVIVWYPKLKDTSDRKQAKKEMTTDDIIGSLYGLLDRVGHASLLLDELADPLYISWWPDGTHTSYATPSYRDDVDAEGGNPSAIENLDCLDEESIKHWWNHMMVTGATPIPYRDEYMPDDNKWRMDTTNCANIVALAMKIGGADRIVPMPQLPGVQMITPIHILKWAQKIKTTMGSN